MTIEDVLKELHAEVKTGVEKRLANEEAARTERTPDEKEEHNKIMVVVHVK